MNFHFFKEMDGAYSIAAAKKLPVAMPHAVNRTLVLVWAIVVNIPL